MFWNSGSPMLRWHVLRQVHMCIAFTSGRESAVERGGRNEGLELDNNGGATGRPGTTGTRCFLCSRELPVFVPSEHGARAGRSLDRAGGAGGSGGSWRRDRQGAPLRLPQGLSLIHISEPTRLGMI